MSHSAFKIGVDGGGTKTELILVDATSTVVARHLAPGCNPSQTGPDQAREILRAGLQALLAAYPVSGLPPSVSALHLYMAGSPLFWREVADSLTGYGPVVTGPDSLPVLELATAGAPGLVLHAGTGSFVAARAPGGSVHYAGGLGWKLGDAGSGFDLGRRAIAYALLELQARSATETRPLSPLTAALQAHTGLPDYATHSRFFYNDPAANATISAFAPRVLELAEHDCGPAQQVVADSVTDLARLADQVIHRLFPADPQPSRAGISYPPPLPCGVSGRILNSVPAGFALRSLVAKLRWPVTLTFITAAPSEGVRRLLGKL
ncbi:BadF/BadG/BcrA/BcrD ATPase family protein [Lacunisphaera limnophila]|uniref:BadF/BadG/BcrA/BcrD ATPase family protein n=1 Tax=Lacunisphaera limnophila TaxID=1838286 RepID=A0A1D8ASX0_9BACT|nr:BadF/BadG/BcrA/BcrD ATPase family protein [Lacunisphaera limnophila]AOS43962.1 BadF/BadG/BcrA/BcrD ATPase family protein [Lacunisphaera limnophila]